MKEDKHLKSKRKITFGVFSMDISTRNVVHNKGRLRYMPP